MLRAPIFCLCLCLFVWLDMSAAARAASTYTVTPGDTLWSISARTHVSVDRIVRLNHLADANYLSLGQVLRLTDTTSVKAHTEVNSSPRVGLKKHAHSTKSRVALRGRHSTRTRATADRANLIASQALWIATHTDNAPSPIELRSLAIARRMVAFEIHLTRTALRYLGVPYVWGGESFGGVDCSGFVQAVFRHNGIELPRTADAQFEVGRRIPQGGLLPGDLVFFETYAAGASHVGIYLGSGRFVHASASDGVRVDSLSEDYYASRYLGARRETI